MDGTTQDRLQNGGEARSKPGFLTVKTRLQAPISIVGWCPLRR